jgi:electron transport complex protein RnfD
MAAQPETKNQSPLTHVGPSPHVANTSLTTHSMMYDVLIGLAPVLLMAMVFFRWGAVVQVGLCVVFCVLFEALFCAMAGKKITIEDGAAVVTGAILGLSLPWNANWYIAAVSSAVGIGLGKIVFGGLGFNIFNPAMVGRAFVMLSFPKETGASAYIAGLSGQGMDIVSQATPLAAAKATAASSLPELWPLLIGSHNGSLGETSVLACLVGGVYLCVRRSASWEIPVALLATVTILGGVIEMLGLTQLTVLQQLASGAIFLGGFFIATDPVTSPITPAGKVVFGAGIGLFTLIIRTFSGYPEGVMFAVLLMNAAVPLINYYTLPRPLGVARKQFARG